MLELQENEKSVLHFGAVGVRKKSYCKKLCNRLYDRPSRPPTLRVSPGNYVLAPARRSNPVLAPEERFWHPFPFLKDQTKINSISMKQNSNWIHFQQLLFHTFPPPLDQYNLFGLTKNGRQNRSSGAKTGLLWWAGAKVSFRETLAMSGAGVVCHMNPTEKELKVLPFFFVNSLIKC